ncbi:MAG: preprotein translocase subunit YajC [Defluviitaleaceae bacterium]|nr:preprotein translocase subunit YajC [Defluviitaleaceae bacterium]
MRNKSFILYGSSAPGTIIAPGEQQNQQNQTNTQATETTTSVGTPADYPQEEAAGGGFFETFGVVAIWIVMIGALWFFMFRPQRKREKAVRQMQNELRVGENVVTTSGFYGKIVGVGTDSFLIEFGEGRGIRVWVRKSDIADVRTPVMTPPPKQEEPAK